MPIRGIRQTRLALNQEHPSSILGSAARAWDQGA